MCLVLAVALSVVALTTATAQQEDTIVEYGFEEGIEGWLTLDTEAMLGVTGVAEEVHSGQGSLKFEYTQRGMVPGQMPGLLAVPLPGGAPGMRSLRFAIGTANSVTLVVAMSEEDGSNYMCPLRIQPGVWHEITLSLDDFGLDMDNSVDENGQLDPEQVRNIALVDAWMFFSQMTATPESPFELVPADAQITWLDDVVLSRAEVIRDAQPDAEIPQGQRAVVVDTCDEEAYRWVSLGADTTMIVDPESSEAGPCYRIDYSMAAGKLWAMMRSVPKGRLAGMERLEFLVGSGGDATLLVGIGEEDKSEYNTVVQVRGLQPWERVQLDFADFTLGEDKIDENGQLDADQISSVMVADFKAMADGEAVQNTLWLDDLIAVGPE